MIVHVKCGEASAPSNIASSHPCRRHDSAAPLLLSKCQSHRVHQLPHVQHRSWSFLEAGVHPGASTYGNHLTPGLAEVRVYAAGFTSFLAGFFRFRAEGSVGTPALKTS